jgi:hypothetical protein
MNFIRVFALLITLVYTQGLLEWLGVPDKAIKVIVEAPVALLGVCTLLVPRRSLAPGWKWALVFISGTFVSGFISGNSVLDSFLYCRWLLYGYIILWGVWNAHLSAQQVHRLLHLILFVWALQVMAAIIKVTVLGSRAEQTVGMMGTTGGAPATVFPLLVLALAVALYCYFRPSLKWVILALGSGIVGFASGKRAVYFYLPAFYGVFVLWFIWREKSVSALKRLKVPVLMGLVSIPFLVFGMRNTHAISSIGFTRGIDPVVAIRFTDFQWNHMIDDFYFALQTAIASESREKYWDVVGPSSSRSSTTANVLKSSYSRGLGPLLFGYGPTSLMMKGDKAAREILNIRYGITGWSRDVMSVGWIAMLSHVGLYVSLWIRVARRRQYSKSPLARSLQWGTILSLAVFLTMYFSYCDAFAMAGWFTYIHFFFIGLVLSPHHAQPKANSQPI